MEIEIKAVSADGYVWRLKFVAWDEARIIDNSIGDVWAVGPLPDHKMEVWHIKGRIALGKKGYEALLSDGEGGYVSPFDSAVFRSIVQRIRNGDKVPPSIYAWIYWSRRQGPCA